MRGSQWLPVLALLSVAGLAACDDTTGPGQNEGQLQVLLTDAPMDYIQSAEVWISRVYLVPEDDGEGEDPEESSKVDLFNDPENPMHFDLLTLQDDITANLTDPMDLEAATYAQLRLVVDDALVTLKEGYEFKDGETAKALKVPSGMQSGIKVHLNGPLVISEGTLTIVTVDFDVSDNFVLQGNPETPAGLHGILFTPTLKEKGRTEAEPVS